jgi:hypothetical protein
MAGQTAFDPKAFGRPNPAWIKKRTRVDGDLERLADHICTRTPPHSYKTEIDLYEMIVRRNHDAIRNWEGGYKALTDRVRNRLIERDGSLWIA